MNLRTSMCLAFVALAFLLSTGTVLADSVEALQHSFRSTGTITLSRELTVPTIVAVTLPPSVAHSSAFAVYSSDGTLLPYQVNRVTSNVVPVQLTYPDSSDPSILSALVDGNEATVMDFLLPEGVGRGGKVTLQYVFDSPITTNSLNMILSRYVVWPTAVTVQADVNEHLQTVLARTRPDRSSVMFPSFTSRVWVVTLEYSQPLRFTELYFFNTGIVEESSTLVFLAQPSREYTLYYDPEVVLSQETGERPQFTMQGAATATLSGLSPNKTYQPADSDHDSHPDFSDNCPRLANEDQKDEDRNGRGDVCDDYDHDGVENGADNCIDTPNRNQADIDRDGLGDECDKEESRLTEKYPWIVWIGLIFAGLVFVGLFYVAVKRSHEVKGEAGAPPTPPVPPTT